uniref:Zinc transporter 11 n=1 Tax=Populus alba TaxID=43335 RepID=A0A4U5N7B6_POPAL|nr:zinc transporter 11 [Populus alba]
MSRSLFILCLLLSLLLLTAGHSGHGDDGDGDGDANHVDTPKINLRSTSLILVKIWCLILIFIGTFIGGVSPYFLKWNEGFLVLGTQFASGVFLGTALMHFLSDANETFEDLTEKKYPFAFMLACAGYLLTMLADSIISHVYSKDVVSQANGGDVELQDAQWYRCCLCKNPKLATTSSFGDSILLIFALCFHSVFEGIAIGVAETKADAWRALWTITLHKIFAAIAMGIALLRMIPDSPLCIMCCLCFRICHFESSWRGHWDYNRCHNSRVLWQTGSLP